MDRLQKILDAVATYGAWLVVVLVILYAVASLAELLAWSMGS